jgi:hypothetical protein
MLEHRAKQLKVNLLSLAAQNELENKSQLDCCMSGRVQLHSSPFGRQQPGLATQTALVCRARAVSGVAA